MNTQRGDTIIEVILASTMLALVTVSSFAIMQRASSSAYDAMERSIVRMNLNGQIELLNYFRDSYSAASLAKETIVPGTPAGIWENISNSPSTTVPTLETCTAPSNSFYIAKTTGGMPTYQKFTTMAASTTIAEPGTGIWIAKKDPSTGSPKKKYQEFYVVACWQATIGNQQRMSSVVRLYDPVP